MTNSLQYSQERNYWTVFQENVYNLLQCTFRTEVRGPIIMVSWDDDKFNVNNFVYTIDFDKVGLNPDDFERDFLEKFKAYLEGATNGKS